MSALSIQVPFPVFQDRDGQPLENGYVWLGQANLNPQTNPVVAYFDKDLTIPAAQPLRTINGYVSRAGTPAQIYVDGVNFSILVQDSKGSMVYNFPDGTGISPDACGLAYNPPFTGGVPYPVCEKLAETVSVKDFGAVGDGVTDDTAAIQAAMTYAGSAGGATVELLGGDTYLLATKTTSGSEISFLRVPNNVNVVGPRSAKIKLATNVGDYTSVFMSSVASGSTAENVSFYGFTIDQNAQNNNGNITPGNLGKVHGAIIFNRRCQNTSACNMAFENAPGVNTVQFSGQDSSNVRVDNNYFEFIRGASTIADYYDNSLVYITANGFSCSGNYCVNNSVSGTGTFEGGVTALEVHGASGIVVDNIVLKFQNGFNIVGFTAGQVIPEYNNIVVANNIANQVRIGVLLWSLTGASLRGVTVTNNKISCDATKFKDSALVTAGIAFYIGSLVAGNFKAINITDNIIEWLNDYESTIASTRSAGISIDAFGAVDNVVVSGNSIYNSPYSGISVFQTSGAGAFNNILTNGNYIENVGRNSLSSVRYGVIWRGVVSNGQCLGNTIVDTSATLTALNGVYMPLLGAGSDALADNNICRSPNSSTKLVNRYSVYAKPSTNITAPDVAGSVYTFNSATGASNFSVSLAVTSSVTFATVTALYPQATGNKITLGVINTSGGTTNITWTSAFVFSTAWVQLTAGQQAYLGFTFNGATSKWYQSGPQMTVMS